jgi:hypothetical protein
MEACLMFMPGCGPATNMSLMLLSKSVHSDMILVRAREGGPTISDHVSRVVSTDQEPKTYELSECVERWSESQSSLNKSLSKSTRFVEDDSFDLIPVCESAGLDWGSMHSNFHVFFSKQARSCSNALSSLGSWSSSWVCNAIWNSAWLPGSSNMAEFLSSTFWKFRKRWSETKFSELLVMMAKGRQRLGDNRPFAEHLMGWCCTEKACCGRPVSIHKSVVRCRTGPRQLVIRRLDCVYQTWPWPDAAIWRILRIAGDKRQSQIGMTRRVEKKTVDKPQIVHFDGPAI